MTFRNDPEGRRLPVRLDATSNGEYAPIPLQPVHREAKHLALEAAATNAKRLGIKRRAFQIAPALRERYSYAELTPALRPKIFGLNSLRIYPVPDDVRKAHLSGDRVARQRAEYRQRPDPSFVTYGPTTRREFLNLLTWDGS